MPVPLLLIGVCGNEDRLPELMGKVVVVLCDFLLSRNVFYDRWSGIQRPSHLPLRTLFDRVQKLCAECFTISYCSPTIDNR
ncbi:hypothetical protein PR048_012600 [Dryococelus australis]|uniref:Uncharacterized protein n=1 Tax=Dryococelus australis TaxID=614101 RepID=A0ABQ9HQK1_9NEOP|nr:hypothetical protein PR048_012600 [Dryococelus australis]